MFYSTKQDTLENEFVDVCSTDDDKENRPPNGQSTADGNTSYIPTTSMLPAINQSSTHFVATKCEESFSQSSCTVNEAESEEDSEKITSRKEKSLGKLCKRFLLAMGEEATNGSDVHLESVARKMSVEKRRIYDIVNVMEALEAMSKTNKSFYKWHGLSALPQLMDSLQREAIEARLPERILKVEQAMCSFTELSPMTRPCSDLVGSLVEEGSEQLGNQPRSGLSSTRSSPMFSTAHTSLPYHNPPALLYTDNCSDSSLQSSQQLRDRNGKNSLAQLCRRFLMVLLCNPKDKRRVSLDVASTVLIKDPENEGFEPPSRSRCRRLYDIANVLVAMGLIKKVHYLFGTKKIPLFVYCGPEPDASPSTSQLSMIEFLQRTGLSGIVAGSESMCLESPTTSLNNSFTNQQINVLAQLGSSTTFRSSSSGSNTAENRNGIPETMETIRPPATSPKINQSSRKRPLEINSQTHFANSTPFQSKENYTNKGPKLCSNDQKEDVKFQLPKPQPRMLQPQSFANNSFISTTQQFHLQAIPKPSLCNQLQAYSMAAAAMAAAAFNQETHPFPPQPLSCQSRQSLNFDTNDKENSYQQKKFNRIGSSPKKPLKAKKFSHSVSSILGVSQAENIANNCNSSSPKAFKPVNHLLPTLPEYYPDH